MAQDYVFKNRKPVQTKGLPILYLLPPSNKTLKKVDGDIGIEIEVEGNKFEKDVVPPPWKYTKDGSLRGEDNAEYILRKPIKFDEVPAALDTLWYMFESYGSVLDESNRTSVHVHLNVQQFHLNRLCSFFALYFLIEELLTAWCGEHRIGNLFCLRAKDAPGIISEIKYMLKNEELKFSDGMHYGGMNASAITKFGSVEIRSLRGVKDPAVIRDWVSVLERIYNLSADFPDPREIPEGFSGNGPIAFAQNLLGDKFDLIVSNIDYHPSEVMEALYEGIRLAQDLCYCRDWSEYHPSTIEKDPFNRDEKVVGQKLSELMTSGVNPMAQEISLSPSLYNMIQPAQSPQSFHQAVQSFQQMYGQAAPQPAETLFPPEEDWLSNIYEEEDSDEN